VELSVDFGPSLGRRKMALREYVASLAQLKAEAEVPALARGR
jgi:hypothetical protein